MPFFPESDTPERSSEAPMSLEIAGTGEHPAARLLARIPAAWLGMSGYLLAGIMIGLVLIVALGVTRGSDGAPSTGELAITDTVTHLHARDIGESCWRGLSTDQPARLTVSLEVGVDGKVRYAVASGATPEMRTCVEMHVRSWEFLPQAQPTALALPFEVDRGVGPSTP